MSEMALIEVCTCKFDVLETNWEPTDTVSLYATYLAKALFLKAKAGLILPPHAVAPRLANKPDTEED